jgi:hypothetical protein
MSHHHLALVLVSFATAASSNLALATPLEFSPGAPWQAALAAGSDGAWRAIIAASKLPSDPADGPQLPGVAQFNVVG